MNLLNSSFPDTAALLALIQRVAGIYDDDAKAVLAAMHAAGYGVVRAPCDGCREVHASLPIVRAFHSPSCRGETHRVCANCHAPMEDQLYGHEVGLICADCL